MSKMSRLTLQSSATTKYNGIKNSGVSLKPMLKKPSLADLREPVPVGKLVFSLYLCLSAMLSQNDEEEDLTQTIWGKRLKKTQFQCKKILRSETTEKEPRTLIDKEGFRKLLLEIISSRNRWCGENIRNHCKLLLVELSKQNLDFPLDLCFAKKSNESENTANFTTKMETAQRPSCTALVFAKMDALTFTLKLPSLSMLHMRQQRLNQLLRESRQKNKHTVPLISRQKKRLCGSLLGCGKPVNSNEATFKRNQLPLWFLAKKKSDAETLKIISTYANKPLISSDRSIQAQQLLLSQFHSREPGNSSCVETLAAHVTQASSTKAKATPELSQKHLKTHQSFLERNASSASPEEDKHISFRSAEIPTVEVSQPVESFSKRAASVVQVKVPSQTLPDSLPKKSVLPLKIQSKNNLSNSRGDSDNMEIPMNVLDSSTKGKPNPALEKLKKIPPYNIRSHSYSREASLLAKKGSSRFYLKRPLTLHKLNIKTNFPLPVSRKASGIKFSLRPLHP